MLIHSKLKDIFIEYIGGDIIELYFTTNEGTYSLNALQIKLIDNFKPVKFELLVENPVKGEKILDVRSDCEVLLIKFENDLYLLKGWTINTMNGEGVQYMKFYPDAKNDKEFLDWFDSMQQLNDDHPKYIL